jgi:hypothetical protein
MRSLSIDELNRVEGGATTDSDSLLDLLREFSENWRSGQHCPPFVPSRFCYVEYYTRDRTDW